jgi:hypothetical protein
MSAATNRGKPKSPPLTPPPADDDEFEAWVLDQCGAGGREASVIAALFFRFRQNRAASLPLVEEEGPQ